ncbi:MAG: carbohydrate ABC transporter permease [Actinomycetota bacterium]
MTRTRTWQPRRMVGYAILTVAALAFVSPFLVAGITSFRSLADIGADPVRFGPGPNDGWTLEGWTRLTEDAAGLGQAAGVSIIVTLMVVVGRVILDAAAGYALSRLRWRGRRVVFAIVLSTLAIPPIVLAVPRFLVMRDLGMLNTLAGLIVPLLFDAFGIYLMKVTFDALPVEIEEAARLDGANLWQQFSRIMLPLAWSGLIVLILLSAQNTWNEFLHPLIAAPSEAGLRTLPVHLSFLAGSPTTSKPWNSILMASLLTSLPTVILFVLFQRRFVAGMSASGVKG